MTQKSYGSAAEERVEGIMLGSCSYDYWRSAQTGQEEAFTERKQHSKIQQEAVSGELKEVYMLSPFGSEVVPILCFPWHPAWSH